MSDQHTKPATQTVKKAEEQIQEQSKRIEYYRRTAEMAVHRIDHDGLAGSLLVLLGRPRVRKIGDR
jgi:hypothetical protein